MRRSASGASRDEPVDAAQLLGRLPRPRSDAATRPRQRVIDVVTKRVKVPGAARRSTSVRAAACRADRAGQGRHGERSAPRFVASSATATRSTTCWPTNHERVKRAQNFFDDNGVVIITALFHASLPEAYLGKRGVQVLDITGELWRSFTRRAQETGQFLINVLSPTPEPVAGRQDDAA